MYSSLCRYCGKSISYDTYENNIGNVCDEHVQRAMDEEEAEFEQNLESAYQEIEDNTDLFYGIQHTLY